MRQILITKTTILVIACVGFLLPGSASAGAANATIACKSISAKGGALQLSGNIPGDLAEFELDLKRNRSETKLSSQLNEQIFVVDDFRNKVFTMVVLGAARRFTMYAIPATIVTSGIRTSQFKAKFNAILGEAPNPTGGEPLSGIRMACTYEYSI